MAKLRLDDRTVRALVPPAAGNRIDYDVQGGPRETFVRGFAVRTTAAGTKTFLLVYVSKDGRERRYKIGDFGAAWTVTTARERARELRLIVDSGGDPFAADKDRRADAESIRARDGATLGGLLTAYVDSLKRAKKPSAKQVEQSLERNLRKPFPKLCGKPASVVTAADLVEVINQLVRDEKWREAEKTRSYLRAAFTAAVAAKGNAATSDLFAAYGHVQNVARDLATVVRPKHDETAPVAEPKRALTPDELRAYWKRIEKLPTAAGALLRFHLLTGAQRCAQLARLTKRDVDRAANVITLLDSKGRRTKARRHVVPLLPEALAALDAMAGDKGDFVVTLDRGKSGAGYFHVLGQLQHITKAMIEAKETTEAFTPGELRITVETRLAAAGVSREDRAQLQSHGLGGVQMRHYVKDEFIEQKRAALETLLRLCTTKPATVTEIGKTRRKKSG